MSEVGQQLDQIASKFNELDILRKKTKSSVNLHTELDSIAFEADNDPDLDSLPKYQQRIDEAVWKHLQTIPQGLARQQAGEEFRLRGYSTFSGVRNSFRRRQIEEQKVLIDDDLSKNAEIYITGSPEERVQALLAANLRIDEGVNAMIYTPEQANRVKESLPYQWEKDRATFDAQYNPGMFLNNKSEYSLNETDSAEINKLAKRAERTQQREAEKLQKIEQDKNVMNFTKAFLDGELPAITINDIQKRIETGQLPVDFGNAFIHAITSPKITQDDIKESQFMTVIKEYLKSDNKSGVMNVLTEALNKTGTTRQKELNAIMKFATDNVQEEKRSLAQNIISEIMKLHEYSHSGMAVKAVSKFIENMNSGMPHNKAKQKAEFDSAIETNKYLLNVSDTGTIMQDPVTGVRKRVFQDGRIEDVK